MKRDGDIDFWQHYVDGVIGEQPQLLPHLLGVAEEAARLARYMGLTQAQQDMLYTAGLVHDLGKIPSLAHTDFHPVDGANIAHDHDAPELTQLVAHHTGARYEADFYGIQIAWKWERSVLHDILCLADLTTMPDGTHVTLATRRADIEARYTHDSVQVRSLNRLWPEVIAIEQLIQTRNGPKS